MEVLSVSKINKDRSKDHQLLQEGMSWKDSMEEEDFNPHIPREEFDLRIANAKKYLDYLNPLPANLRNTGRSAIPDRITMVRERSRTGKKIYSLR
jgi:hypothetical protein